MRQDDADHLRGFLALNALLREELRDVRRLVEARRNETKYNPNWRWQPRAPVGTREGGRWIGGGAAPSRSARPRDPPPPPTTARTTTVALGIEVDTNGIPTPGWAEPDWEYPASPQRPLDGELTRMNPETELMLEAAITAYNAAEELNYRRVMGRSAEDSYEARLIEQGVSYYRNVFVDTREGLRIYDFMQLGPLGWEFVEVKANRAIATPRQVRIDTAVQIFGFSLDIGPFQGIQGPTNVRLMRSIPSDRPTARGH